MNAQCIWKDKRASVLKLKSSIFQTSVKQEWKAHCGLDLAFLHLHACSYSFPCWMLFKEIPVKRRSHNIGYLMCRDILLEWNSQRNFPRCHSVSVKKKKITFDTAASSGEPRQVGLSGPFCLVLVLEAFCHFSTYCFLPLDIVAVWFLNGCWNNIREIRDDRCCLSNHCLPITSLLQALTWCSLADPRREIHRNRWSCGPYPISKPAKGQSL